MIEKFFMPAAAPFIPWILGILAAAFLGLGGTIWVQGIRIDSFKAQRDAAYVQRDAANEANASNLLVIEGFKSANKELAEGRKADQAKAAKAVAELENYQQQVAADLAAAKAARGMIYANDKNALDWSGQPLPGRIADRMR